MFRNVVLAVVATAGIFGTQVAKAGPARGNIDKIFVIQPGDQWSHTLTLNGGEWTLIRVDGDGSSCLTVEVFDESGNLVISDTIGSGDVRAVRVKPGSTGKFTIRVTNPGNDSNVYRLRVK